MFVLYVTSLYGNSGKTMLCSGLAKTWANKGKKAGFLKPLFNNNTSVKDILFMRRLLGLEEPVEVIGPSISVLSESANVIKQALSAISNNKDIVLIEGLPLASSSDIIEALDSKVLVIHDYSSPLNSALPEYKKLGSRLMGIVINKVPKRQLARKRSQFSEELEKRGVNLLGVLPEDRILMSMSVMDLAEAVQGKILNCPDKGEEIIENFMMGSSTFDRGPVYYNRKENKAVILWGERPGFRKAALSNLQLAAIQTSVKCMVITNNATPIPGVAQKAEEKQIPLISAGGDIKSVISVIENSFSTLKFNQEKKVPHLLEVFGQNLNFQLLAGV